MPIPPFTPAPAYPCTKTYTLTLEIPDVDADLFVSTVEFATELDFFLRSDLDLTLKSIGENPPTLITPTASTTP